MCIQKCISTFSYPQVKDLDDECSRLRQELRVSEEKVEDMEFRLLELEDNQQGDVSVSSPPDFSNNEDNDGKDFHGDDLMSKFTEKDCGSADRFTLSSLKHDSDPEDSELKKRNTDENIDFDSRCQRPLIIDSSGIKINKHPVDSQEQIRSNDAKKHKKKTRIRNSNSAGQIQESFEKVVCCNLQTVSQQPSKELSNFADLLLEQTSATEDSDSEEFDLEVASIFSSSGSESHSIAQTSAQQDSMPRHVATPANQVVIDDTNKHFERKQKFSLDQKFDNHRPILDYSKKEKNDDKKVQQRKQKAVLKANESKKRIETFDTAPDLEISAKINRETLIVNSDQVRCMIS